MTQILIGTAVFTGLVMILVMIVLGARMFVWGRGQAQFVINGERTFNGPLGGKLIDTLSHEGIHLPTSCNGAGTCGLCRVQVSGPIDDVLPIERAKLSDHDIKNNYRLACQVVVRGDMAVTLAPEMLGTETWSCKVVSTRTLSPLIKEIVLAFPPGKERDLPAGSYVLIDAPAFNLSFADMEVCPEHEDSWQRLDLRALSVKNTTPQARAYSLVLRPDSSNQIALNVRLALPPVTHPKAPPGIVSSYLFSLKTEDEVSVVGPYGHFFVADSSNEMIFIGGGVGMAPLYTLIYDQLEKQNTTRSLSYWYGARSKIDLYYADEMEMLAEKHAHFSWCPVLSEPLAGDDWSGETGFVHDIVYQQLLKDHPNPAACEYYLCGPPLMIQAVRVMLDKLGVPNTHIFSDDFGA